MCCFVVMRLGKCFEGILSVWRGRGQTVKGEEGISVLNRKP